mgnify:CR=1 FL=1
MVTRKLDVGRSASSNLGLRLFLFCAVCSASLRTSLAFLLARVSLVCVVVWHDRRFVRSDPFSLARRSYSGLDTMLGKEYQPPNAAMTIFTPADEAKFAKMHEREPTLPATRAVVTSLRCCC